MSTFRLSRPLEVFQVIRDFATCCALALASVETLRVSWKSDEKWIFHRVFKKDLFAHWTCLQAAYRPRPTDVQTVSASVLEPWHWIGNSTILSWSTSFPVSWENRKWLNLTTRVKCVLKNRQLANISETKGPRASRFAAFDAESYSVTISDTFPELWDLAFSRYGRKTVWEMLKRMEVTAKAKANLRTPLHCIFRGRTTV
jgi:hypothetical protein